MLPFMAALGGGGLSASSSATSGDNESGAIGISVGGIQTGGTSGGLPSWVFIAAAAVAVLWFMKRK